MGDVRAVGRSVAVVAAAVVGDGVGDGVGDCDGGDVVVEGFVGWVTMGGWRVEGAGGAPVARMGLQLQVWKASGLVGLASGVQEEGARFTVGGISVAAAAPRACVRERVVLL